MKDYRPVLIGMNNPVSMEPRFALYPLPPGCTGNRIFLMLKEFVPDITMKQYVDAFDRRNLCRGNWKLELGRVAAANMLPDLAGREVVLLGAEPRAAFGLPPMLIHPHTVGSVVFRQVPHPSGRNPWYNDEECRKVAGALFAELYNKSTARSEA